MKIEHVVANLEDVLNWYRKDFQNTNGMKITRFGETLVDSHKGKVVFELYLENDEERRFRSHGKPLSPLQNRPAKQEKRGRK